MSTKKAAEQAVEAAEPVTYDPNERVEIFIPRPASSKDDPNLFVSVNGNNFILPKGKTSSVPRYIYNEIMRSWAAAAHQDESKRDLQARSNQPAAM